MGTQEKAKAKRHAFDAILKDESILIAIIREPGEPGGRLKIKAPTNTVEAYGFLELARDAVRANHEAARIAEAMARGEGPNGRRVIPASGPVPPFLASGRR